MYDDNNDKYCNKAPREIHPLIRKQTDFERLIDEHSREKEERRDPKKKKKIIDRIQFERVFFE